MKKYLLLLAMIFASASAMMAQDVFDFDDEDEEEEEEIEMTEDEVMVTDQEGNEEVIDFPEAMTYDLDSLMNLYMSKTYLSQADADDYGDALQRSGTEVHRPL